MAGRNYPALGTAPTERELEILWFIAHGLGQKGVAKRVHISAFSVKSHLGRMSRRLGATGADHLIGICFRMGWFPLQNRGFVLTLDEQKRERRLTGRAGRG
jgi:DNA-binding CsgD family transcriptional regulator